MIIVPLQYFFAISQQLLREIVTAAAQVPFFYRECRKRLLFLERVKQIQRNLLLLVCCNKFRLEKNWRVFFINRNERSKKLEFCVGFGEEHGICLGGTNVFSFS